jgi:hypothetical protein
MMSTCCSKHVDALNKYIKKECVKLVINQNYVKMHGQKNIKHSLTFLPSIILLLTLSSPPTPGPIVTTVPIICTYIGINVGKYMTWKIRRMRKRNIETDVA